MQAPLDSDEATAPPVCRIVPSDYLSVLVARRLLGLTLQSEKGAEMVSKAFAAYQ